ncbi:MAG: hypothetical protein HY813_00185 [Candidatus Portnoybacteria bacterium]|nr:hypothetical protein [Candidatus Portnoybacteria bacterium]
MVAQKLLDVLRNEKEFVKTVAQLTILGEIKWKGIYNYRCGAKKRYEASIDGLFLVFEEESCAVSWASSSTWTLKTTNDGQEIFSTFLNSIQDELNGDREYGNDELHALVRAIDSAGVLFQKEIF